MNTAADKKADTSIPPASDAASPRASDVHRGTDILPMPESSKKVAGMPRAGRAFSDPGDPGVITPEDDYLETSNLDNRRG